MIVKENGKFVVKSADGKKVLGTYATEEEAKAKLAQIEKFSKDGSTCQTCDGSGTIDDQEAADETGLEIGDDCPDCDGKGYLKDEQTHLVMSDEITIDGVERTRDGKLKLTGDGYLPAFVKVARTGIQIYKGREVGRPQLDSVRVYRPEAEVFHADAMKSFAHRPITLRHPSEEVTSKNWKKYARGHTGDAVVRDGEFIRVPVLMMDQEVISAVDAGVKELSMGYSTDLKWRHGFTDSGEEYDAIQTAIRGNHLALVPNARGGKELRVGDAKRKEKTKMKIMVDGVPVDIEDDVAGNVIRVALDKGVAETKRLGDQVKKVTDEAAAAAKTAQDALDAEKKKVEALTGEKVVLEKKVKDAEVTPERLDVMVKDRLAVCDRAAALLPKEYKFDGKTIEQIKKDAVAAQLGDGAKALTTDAEIGGAFTALTKDVKVDGTGSLAQDISRSRSGTSQVKDSRDEAFSELEKSLQNSWQTPKAA